ncbi:MAG: METTL5 family protein [Nanoarchaeota archaeon]|nr:METTL5 family protein [Nanoarchaeota archaeon]MBU4284117.1 METTL5 family protein [Nanoarchaeota archaeon]
MIKSKSKLAVLLSKLRVFETPKLRAEQYTTDSEIAADVLWQAYYLKDIENKTIADLGSGTGILGLGILLLGAKKVFFVESDSDSVKIAKDNLCFLEEKTGKKLSKKAVFLNKNIDDFNKKVDTVVQNPPFGTKQKHADKIFLKKAFSLAKVIYSFHKLETAGFVNKISEDYGFEITHLWKFDFPIKAIYSFHRKKIQRIKVGCWRMKKIK